ncbi:tRNA pseudouridine(13) synthase [hydrothermal vent metagenome]|uniref:tRNA pseudouridine(13) synthase n=1 Tax=hydrothermal vent metagenome TaxID=652676 RepID=A0A3B0Z0P7_9ZZZZ
MTSKLLPPFKRINNSVSSGLIKQQAEDFEVNEVLVYEPVGEGEHAFVYVRKIGETTLVVAKKIAELAEVKIRQVSYAGLKDKHALTRQWFSVHLPGKPSPDWSLLNSESLWVEQSTRHDRKLRQGQIKTNNFKVIIKSLAYTSSSLDDFIQRVLLVGVPNYFTEQRFGIEANNLKNALLLLQATTSDAVKPKRKKYSQQRGLYISAARSLLFNQVLSARVQHDSWNKAIDGDLFIKSGRHGMFSVDAIDQDIIDRLQTLQISPTGPLYGIKSMNVQGQAACIENNAMSDYSQYQLLLTQQKIKADRRALRLVVDDLRVTELSSDSVQFSFNLPSGCYATAVLREFIHYPGQML